MHAEGESLSLSDGSSVAKTLLPVQETQGTRVQSLGQEDPLEKGMVTHSTILAGKYVN